MPMQELNAPFKYDEYKVNYEGYVAVGPQSVADRLNEVFTIFNWSHDILEFQEDYNEFTVSVRGLLKIRDPHSGEWVTRTQFGDKKIVMASTAERPKAQAFLDAKKAAVSDSLKKCAALFGVASDVYKGRIKSVKSGRTKGIGEYSELYLALAHFFQLNYQYDSRFEHGITILPEDYRGYYEKHNMTGIFENDKKIALEWWRQKKSSSPVGKSTQIQNAIRTENSNQQSTSTSSKEKNNRNTDPLAQQLYEYVDMIAGAHPETQQPYFKLTFLNRGEEIDLFAIDQNVMDFIDKINPRVGNKFKIKTIEGNNGKLILKHLLKTVS
ncbi:Rad52/Rad22 family DNA repair protein [Paenibacillus sp. IITD108]|uniref:Rad52/Rad22 family DNA repair protein n=1 Tax=Paenibacillus sp. IITD108 TaxID=3116649 RepID=UPI002F401DB2